MLHRPIKHRLFYDTSIGVSYSLTVSHVISKVDGTRASSRARRFQGAEQPPPPPSFTEDGVTRVSVKKSLSTTRLRRSKASAGGVFF